MSDACSSGSGSLQSPPCSPTRPITCPYVCGASFTAHRHEPPAPFGGCYSQSEPPSQGELECMVQLDWCLVYPPAEGKTNSNDAYPFTIQSEIRTGDDCGAQLVLTDTGQVAKIYDELFYPSQDSEQPQQKVDVAVTADSDYSIEAAAYSELCGHPIQGSIMPQYYGSWTINVTSIVQDEQITREVCMILMEHVPGIRMLDINPEDLTPEERENIMIKVIEADYDLRYAGVQHDDLSPRNIIVTAPFDLADPNLRLVLVDFGMSTVLRIRYGGLPPDEHRNPLFEWSWPSRWSSYGWTSPCGDESVARLWELFGNGRNGKYVQVEKDPESQCGRPLDPLWPLIP